MNVSEHTVPAVKAVLFDLDGTLLPMDQDLFTKTYFKLLAKKMSPYGYEPQALIDAIWAGTAAMVKNDGTKSNEDAFWNRFAQVLGEQVLTHKPLFDAFYRNEFQEAKAVCGCNPAATETLSLVKAAGLRAALATNPIFPAVATESRVRWAGLDPADFELYTCYENIAYCKPNPAYYLELAKRLQLAPEHCLMVGNDVDEDMTAAETGMQVFLLTDCMINKSGKSISEIPHGDFSALQKYLRTK